MIIGIGFDLVELRRVENALHRFSERFLARIMTDAERELLPETYLNQISSYRIAHVAARFAAKEATVKALGTGFANGISPRDCEVLSLPSGKPQLFFHGKALDYAQSLGVSTVHLSLTHTRDNAAAVVILEKSDHIE